MSQQRAVEALATATLLSEPSTSHSPDESCAPIASAVDPQSESHERQADPSLEALCIAARLHRIAAEPASLMHRLGWPPSRTLGSDDLLFAAKELGLKARRSSTSIERLDGERLNVKPAQPVGGTMLGTAQDARSATAEADRMHRTRLAIAERRPIVGMTEDELVQAFGRPGSINASNYGGQTEKQWVYGSGATARCIYTSGGVVTSMQWTEAHA